MDFKCTQHPVYWCILMLGYAHIKGWGQQRWERSLYLRAQWNTEFSQDSAFFCIPDPSVSVYGVPTLSPHNASLPNPVNPFPSAPHGPWETWELFYSRFLYLVQWQDLADRKIKFHEISNSMKMLKITTCLEYRSWRGLSAPHTQEPSQSWTTKH